MAAAVGRIRKFPEVDRAQWFPLTEALRRINPAQVIERRQVHLLDRIEHEPGEVVALRQPLPQRRRQQQLLVTITRDEVLSHAERVLSGPDSRGVCATATGRSGRAGTRPVGLSRTTVKLKLPKALRKLLWRTHKLSLRLTAKVRGPAGHSRTVKTVKRLANRPRGREDLRELEALRDY